MRTYTIGDETYTESQLLDSAMDGYCAACGTMHEGQVEPDARRYECAECGEAAVYSVLELVLMGSSRVKASGLGTS